MENSTIIAGLVVILIASNGLQYALNETGKELRCYTGWENVDGYKYQCVSESSTREAYCLETRDSANTKNYYCREGILVEADVPPPDSVSTAPSEHCFMGGCEATT